MKKVLRTFTAATLDSLRDLAPVFLVIAFFQLLILQQPLDGLFNLTIGLVLVVLGLTFFVFGLETGLFPIGGGMAHAFARKGSVTGLLSFAFALGLGTTIAEPALIAVAEEASEMVQTMPANRGSCYSARALLLLLTFPLEIILCHS